MLMIPTAREGYGGVGGSSWLTGWSPGHLASGESPEWSRVSKKKVDSPPSGGKDLATAKYRDSKRHLPF